MKREILDRVKRRSVTIHDVVDPDEVFQIALEVYGSQAALVRAIGVTPTYISAVTRGAASMGPKVYKHLGIEPFTVWRVRPNSLKIAA